MAFGEFEEWRMDGLVHQNDMLWTMDSESHADAVLGEVIAGHWNDWEPPFCYGDVVEFRRLVALPGSLWSDFVAMITRHHYTRTCAVMMLKAFPLAFEGGGDAKAFHASRRALFRLYARALGMKLLPGAAGRDGGWMWKPVRVDARLVRPTRWKKRWDEPFGDRREPGRGQRGD